MKTTTIIAIVAVATTITVPVVGIVAYSNREPTAWDRMTAICKDSGGIRHSYIDNIYTPLSCIEAVKCADGVNYTDCPDDVEEVPEYSAGDLDWSDCGEEIEKWISTPAVKRT